MQAADIGPVPERERTQSAADLFLIFAGANIAPTTLQVGASLAGGLSTRATLLVIALGSVAGSALVAALAPLGPRLLVPSVIAARAALGTRGAALVAAILFAGNFVWIALNNVMAGSGCALVLGGPRSLPLWAFGLGVLATGVVAIGPRAVGLADRFAVPVLLLLGVLLTVACFRSGAVSFGPASAAAPPRGLLRGLDVVIGYQVSWILMFADYSRYTRGEGRAASAVFLGLAVTSLWFMPVGLFAARAGGSDDPGAMLSALGLGGLGALLLTLASVTTNFVNIYLSGLALKSLWPGAPDKPAVVAIGLVGSALGLLSGRLLEQLASFMLVIGGLLVPVGGILVAHFLRRRDIDVGALVEGRGPRLPLAGLLAWIAGAAAYALALPIGATLPSLLTSMLVYAVVSRLTSRG